MATPGPIHRNRRKPVVLESSEPTPWCSAEYVRTGHSVSVKKGEGSEIILSYIVFCVAHRLAKSAAALPTDRSRHLKVFQSVPRQCKLAGFSWRHGGATESTNALNSLMKAGMLSGLKIRASDWDNFGIGRSGIQSSPYCGSLREDRVPIRLRCST